MNEGEGIAGQVEDLEDTARQRVGPVDAGVVDFEGALGGDLR